MPKWISVTGIFKKSAWISVSLILHNSVIYPAADSILPSFSVPAHHLARLHYKNEALSDLDGFESDLEQKKFSIISRKTLFSAGPSSMHTIFTEYRDSLESNKKVMYNGSFDWQML